MVANWEYEYNGLTFGGGTSFGVGLVEGLSPPDSREEIIERAMGHGSFVYAPYVTERRITMEGDIVGTSDADFATKVDQWRSAFLPREVALPLKFLFPGEVQKRVNCVPVKRSFAIDLDYNLKFAKWMLQLLAEDPRIYSDVENSDTIAANTTKAIVNGGKAPTYPVVEFQGPCTNPMAMVDDEGVHLSTNLVAVANKRIVDFGARTVVDENGVSHYSELIEPLVDVTFLGRELLTPTSPAGLVAGAIVGDDLVLDTASEAGGTPPNAGIVMPVGLTTVDFTYSLGANDRATIVVRNITTGVDVASSLQIAPGFDITTTTPLEFTADGTSAYQFQVRCVIPTVTVHNIKYSGSHKHKWWELAPGSNNVEYRTATGTPIATIKWRDAWL